MKFIKFIAYFFTIVFLILGLAGLFGFLESGQPVKAAASDNVSGFAWSENIGWISFNNISDGSPVDYGVNIDTATGDLSGHAWSENIGWISFNRSETGNPPAPPFNGGSGPIAKYDSSTGALTGWMRVLANGGGWDGWIRFCDATVSKCSGADQIARIDASGDWHGWAWSDMVVGWVSFNSADPGAGGSNYKVKMSSGGVCLDTCASLGYECGTHTICGKVVNCGGCPVGFVCVSGKCVVKPTADIKANGSDGPIVVDFADKVNITWTSANATSCSVAPDNWSGTSGAHLTDSLIHDVTYTLTCVGPGGSATDSVDIKVNFPFPSWKEVAP